MSEVLREWRRRIPAYKDVPDKLLTQATGKVYPDLLALDDEFAEDFERYERGDALRLQQQELEENQDVSLLKEFRNVTKDINRSIAKSAIEALAIGPLEAVGRVAESGVMGTPVGAPGQIVRDTEESAFTRAGQVIRGVAEKILGESDTELEDDFMLRTFPQALGSATGFIGGGAALKALQVPTALGIASLGAASGGVQGFNRAKAAGADDETAFKSFVANAGVGTSEAIPLSKMLTRINGATGGALSRVFIEGGEEALQEVFQESAGNAIANVLTDEDVKLMEGTLESGAAGGMTGFLLSLLTHKYVPSRGLTEKDVDAVNPAQEIEAELFGPRPTPTELMVPDPPSPNRPESFFRVPRGVDPKVTLPRTQYIEVEQATLDAAADYLANQIAGREELKSRTEGGKLPTGQGALLQPLSETPGFLQTAEQRIGSRREAEPTVQVEPVDTSTPLKEVEDIVRSQLEQRDFARAVATLGSTSSETSAKVIDELLGIGETPVPLSAAERTVFNEVWEKVLIDSLSTPPGAASIEDAVSKVQPSRQSLGIVPPELRNAQAFFDTYMAAPTNEQPIVKLDTTTIAPDFQPYDIAQQVANRPNGLGRVRGLGQIFDPRARSNNPVDRAFITRGLENVTGKAIASSFAQQVKGSLDGPFQREGSKITNVKVNKEGAPLHISDFFEQLQKDPSVYDLSPDQQKAVDKTLGYLREIQDFMTRNGIDDQLSSVEGEEVNIESKQPYFPRIRILTDAERRGGGGATGVAAKPFFKKTRFFESEGLGSERGITYEPSIEKRLSTLMARAYQTLADKRLLENPSLQGEKIPDRKQRFLQAFAQDIADGVVSEEKVIEKASEPTPGKEGRVYRKGFSDMIFPVDTAELLNERLNQQTSRFREAFLNFNSAMKAITFGIDIAAPFLQGQIMMLSGLHSQKWATATGHSLKALFTPDGMTRYLGNPDNLKAMREMSQLGASFGQMQDFMAGMREGGLLPKTLELYGRPGALAADVIERFGRSFQTFSEVALIEMWKATKGMVDAKELPSHLENLQNLLSMGRTEELGITRGQASLEQAILLAPRYLRGSVNLVATAMTQSGKSGWQVKKALAGYMMSGTILMYGLMKALDYDDDEIMERLNPASPDFMMIPVKFSDGGIRNVGLGGPIRSLARLMGEVTESMLKNDGRLFSTGAQENPVLRWLRGKLAPMPGLVSDSWLGVDFLGNDISPMDALSARMTPLVVQNAKEILIPRPGELPATTSDVLSGFLGFSVWPQSRWKSIDSDIKREAKLRGVDNFRELPLKEQLSIYNDDILKRPEYADRLSRPKQIEAAMKFQQEREKKLKNGLSTINKKWLEALRLRVPTYDTKLSFGRQKLPLFAEEIEAYEELIIREYDTALNKINWERLSALDSFRRQELISNVLGAAKKKARGQLIRAFRQ